MASPHRDSDHVRYENALYGQINKFRSALERVARYFCIVIGQGCIPLEWGRDVVNDAIEELYLCLEGTPLDTLPPDKTLYARLCGIIRGKVTNLAKHYERVNYDSDALPLSRPCCPAAEHRYDLEIVLLLLRRHFSPTDYEIIMLFAEGYSASEIAQRVGMRPDCVRQHIARIRAKLRTLIGERKTHGGGSCDQCLGLIYPGIVRRYSAINCSA